MKEKKKQPNQNTKQHQLKKIHLNKKYSSDCILSKQNFSARI